MTWPRMPCAPGDAPDHRHLVPGHGLPSRISSVTVLPSFSPAVAASVRSAAAVRPCLPITRPSSPGATYSSTSVVPRVLGLDDLHLVGPIGQRARQHLDDVA